MPSTADESTNGAGSSMLDEVEHWTYEVESPFLSPHELLNLTEESEFEHAGERPAQGAAFEPEDTIFATVDRAELDAAEFEAAAFDGAELGKPMLDEWEFEASVGEEVDRLDELEDLTDLEDSAHEEFDARGRAGQEETARFGEFLLESAVADRGGEQLGEESAFGGDDLAGEELGEDELRLLANEWESGDAPSEPRMEGFEGSEHKAIGDQGSGGAKTALVAGAANTPLTFGDVVALAGDMYASYYDLVERSGKPAGRLELAWALWKALKVPNAPEPPAADTAKKAEEVKKEVRDRYYSLAAENISHFSAGGTGVKHYMKWHADAMANALFAGQSGDDHQWRIAVGKEAFSDHYLTDIFAAGHVRTPRAEIKEWYKQHGLGSSTPFVNYMAAFMFPLLRGRNPGLSIPIVSGLALWALRRQVRELGGEALQSFSLGDIVSLALHDLDNKGLDVVSKVDATGRRHANGHRWRAIGDGHLLKARDEPTQQTVKAMRETRQMVTAAVAVSFRDLVRVRDAGRRIGKRNLTSPAKAQVIKQALKGNLFPALDYVPKEDTTRSNPTLTSAKGRPDLEWRWGQLGPVACVAVDEAVKGQIANEIAEKAKDVPDPATGPLGIKIHGTSAAFQAFVDHLAKEGIGVLQRAVGKQAGAACQRGQRPGP